MNNFFPVFIFGDHFLCHKNIREIKSQHPISCSTLDLSTESHNSIRMEVGSLGLDHKGKLLILQNLPTRKSTLDFLINLSQTCPKEVLLVLWDSENNAKIDSKTKTLNKTWLDFISKFRKIEGASVINHGDYLNEKNVEDSLEFVRNEFRKNNKYINDENILLFLKIVGYDRLMLHTEIEKLSLTCPDKVDSQFIIENAFYSSKESSLLKLSLALNTGSYEKCLNVLERFLESDFNKNELAVVIFRQARWQLAAIFFWLKGYDWHVIKSKLLNMGKFPALTWHNPNLSDEAKMRDAAVYEEENGRYKYLIDKMGIPSDYLNLNPEKKNRAEILPHFIVADQIVDFIKTKIVQPNQEIKDIKLKVFNRALKVYSFMAEKLAEVRYNENSTQDLQEMLRVFTNMNLNSF
jgi:hypothetical protein